MKQRTTDRAHLKPKFDEANILKLSYRLLGIRDSEKSDNTSRFCHLLASVGAENGKHITVQVNFAQNLNLFVIKLSKLY